MGQVNNVFLIVAITAAMAIVTAVLTFFVDMISPAITGNGTITAADTIAVVSNQTSIGH